MPEILQAQRERFHTLFSQLGVGGSRSLVEQQIQRPEDPPPPPPAELLAARREVV